MKALQLAFVLYLAFFTSAQLTPIKTEEEIKIDLNLQEKIEIQPSDIKKNKIYDKLYEVDQEAYEYMKNSFKNVVLYSQKLFLAFKNNQIRDHQLNHFYFECNILFSYGIWILCQLDSSQVAYTNSKKCISNEYNNYF